MESADDSPYPEWSMSANGSDVAQTGSSNTFEDYSMCQGLTPETLDSNDFAPMQEIFGNQGFSGDVMSGGQSGFLRQVEPFHTQFPHNYHWYSQQNILNNQTGFLAMDLSADFPNTESMWRQPYPTPNEPWNSQSCNAREFDAGTTAFLDDSPESASDQGSYSTWTQSFTSTQESTKHDMQPCMSDHNVSSPTVENGCKQLTWEQNCVSSGGLLMINEMIQKESEGRQRRGRKGPLPIQSARHAYQMRRKGACLYCRVHKIKCSLETPCQSCLHLQSSPSPIENRLCCRSVFNDFGVLYFPRVLTSHLTRDEVKEFTRQHVKSMPNNGFFVKATCERGFQPMRLMVHAFVPKTDELMSHHHLVAAGDDGSPTLTSKPSAPIGMLGVIPRELRKTCLRHIKSMVAEPDYPRIEATNNRGALGKNIRYQALGIVHRYSRQVKDPMIDNVLQLHAMHHFMKSIIEFLDESAEDVAREVKKVLDDQHQEDSYDSSRLLNRQLKQTMHDLQKEWTMIILDGLERRLKKREKDGWPTWFCVLIILCLATEDVQTAIDTFIVSDKLLLNDSDVFHEFRQSHQDCWNLEDKLYHQFVQFFHDAYQTGKRTNGFNPIVDKGCSTSWNHSTKVMLREIDCLMQHFSSNINTLSALQVLDKNQFWVDSPSFLRDNPGRLVSKLLVSFLRH